MRRAADTRIRRGLLLLLGVALVFGGIVPAIADLSKSKAKKIAQKQVRKLGDNLFIEETEMVRFGFHMNAGDPDREIGQFGPFTVRAQCQETGGENVSKILIATSQPGSISDSYGKWEQYFDPADGFIDWSTVSDTVGGPPVSEVHALIAHATSPSGASLQAFIPTYADLGGFDCAMGGFINVSQA